MIRRKVCLLLTIGILGLSAPKAFAAFESLSISTFAACVTFSGNPRLAHTAITQLTPDHYAVISGTASSSSVSNYLSDIYINYYITGETAYSTSTVTVGSSVIEKYFSSSIPVNASSNPDYFYYRITVVDDLGRRGYWPNDGAFYALYVARPPDNPPHISHCQIDYISAIEELMVATGTVTGTDISTISMYYNTDGDISYSTYSITLSTRPSSYNFRFELTKNAVNFAKAKYFHYYLKAADISGRFVYLPSSGSVFTAEIIAEKTVTLGTGGGDITLPNGNPGDGQTSIDIPLGALEGATVIKITQVDPADNSVPPGKPPCASLKPMAVYNFTPEKLVFNKFVEMKLVFQDADHDGVVDGTLYRTNSLKIFWWDGFDWRLLGGKNDPELNIVSYGKIKHFSTYALFPVTSMNDNDYKPKERIITPATIDNKNDVAIFDGLTEGDVVNIYDVAGRKIRQLSDDFNWDGKNDGGDIVESGIYIYQIKLGESGKIISGTVVVAK